MSVLKTLRTRRYDEPVDTDDIYYVLSNRRRRMVLQYLSEHNSSEPISRRTLVDHLAEQGGIQRDTANVSLYQQHLPTLADHGMVDYNSDRGLVSITDFGIIAITVHGYIQIFLAGNK